jgi:hypothetical protein
MDDGRRRLAQTAEQIELIGHFMSIRSQRLVWPVKGKIGSCVGSGINKRLFIGMIPQDRRGHGA